MDIFDEDELNIKISVFGTPLLVKNLKHEESDHETYIRDKATELLGCPSCATSLIATIISAFVSQMFPTNKNMLDDAHWGMSGLRGFAVAMKKLGDFLGKDVVEIIVDALELAKDGVLK